MPSLTLFSRCPMPSGRSERASVITFSVLARKSESGAVSCSVLTGFGFFFPAAFEVLERNLLVLTGPKEHFFSILGERSEFLRGLGLGREEIGDEEEEGGEEEGGFFFLLFL